MRLVFSKKFVRQYRKLPKKIQELVDKRLEFLLIDFRYPSLSLKKMQGSGNIWEARITESYRFTFQIEENNYILRKIGTHKILKRP